MDQGQGLIDRFIFLVPTCFRPTPEERETAHNYVKDQKITSFDDFFSVLYDLHLVSKKYSFDEDAVKFLKEQEDEFITLLNDALRAGMVPPKCKKIDIAQRLALSIHVCENITSQLLQGINPTPPPEKINKDSLCKAFKFLEYCEMQKEILLEVSYVSLYINLTYSCNSRLQGGLKTSPGVNIFKINVKRILYIV